jgi:glutathione S-transferase
LSGAAFETSSQEKIMKLIGMLDSPYVRRVAISLQLLGLEFVHDPLSVFRTFDQFKAINPLVKAPTFVCDDGTVLMDSTLILAYAEALAKSKGNTRLLMPSELKALQRELRLVGIALTACEKSVQVLYERKLRPEDKQHEPWLTRVKGQTISAFDVLEAEIQLHPLNASRKGITQAGICAAVAWKFAQEITPDVVVAANYPTIAAFSSQAELLPEFKSAPYGDGTYPVAHHATA